MAFGLIGFDHYKVSCVIGTLLEEREKEQDLFFDVRIEYDFSLPARADSFEDAICYEKLALFCRDFAREKKCQLVETLAFQLLEALFKEFKITFALVRIKKPSAISFADHAVVELERGKRR